MEGWIAWLAVEQVPYATAGWRTRRSGRVVVRPVQRQHLGHLQPGRVATVAPVQAAATVMNAAVAQRVATVLQRVGASALLLLHVHQCHEVVRRAG